MAINKIIILSHLKLKTFTLQDALDYCQINSINPDNIIILILGNNQLTDISGIKLFKNLEKLFLDNNNISDISIIKNFKNLKELYISNNKTADISVLKDLNKLQILIINNTAVKDISVIQNLNNLKILGINNLKLESDQIKYINSIKYLRTLYCKNGFKEMSILSKLNQNINIIK